MKNKKNIDASKAAKANVWVKPSIKKLGNAKDLVANIDVVGGGDLQFSVLNPS